MKELYKSLASLQQEVGTIGKDSTGFGYKYTSLDKIVEIVTPLLKKNKLGYTQLLEGTTLKTVLFHTETGETLEANVDIPQGVQLAKMNEFQVLGSAITYLRRYSLSAMLGLVTDEDTDAKGDSKTAKKAINSLDAGYSQYYDTKKAPVSEKQKNLIRMLAKKQGVEDSAIEDRIKQLKDSSEASGAINRLKELSEE